MSCSTLLSIPKLVPTLCNKRGVFKLVRFFGTSHPHHHVLFIATISSRPCHRPQHSLQVRLYLHPLPHPLRPNRVPRRRPSYRSITVSPLWHAFSDVRSKVSADSDLKCTCSLYCFLSLRQRTSPDFDPYHRVMFRRLKRSNKVSAAQHI